MTEQVLLLSSLSIHLSIILFCTIIQLKYGLAFPIGNFHTLAEFLFVFSFNLIVVVIVINLLKCLILMISSLLYVLMITNNHGTYRTLQFSTFPFFFFLDAIHTW